LFYALEYHVSRLKRNNIDITAYYPDYQESNVIRDSQIKNYFGRRLSLDSFRYLAYIDFIEKNLIPTTQIENYLEIGAGNGGFSRTISIVTKAKVFICDLAEGLYLSKMFLEASFDGNKTVF